MNDDQFNANVQFLLGKLDGKMDMVLNNLTGLTARLDDVEGRVSTNENRLTTLEADKVNNKSNKSFMVSIVSVLIAVASAVKDLFFK